MKNRVIKDIIIIPLFALFVLMFISLKSETSDADDLEIYLNYQNFFVLI